MAAMYHAHVAGRRPAIGTGRGARPVTRPDTAGRPPGQHPGLLRLVDVGVLALVGLSLAIGYASAPEGHRPAGLAGLHRPEPMVAASQAQAAPTPVTRLPGPQPERVPPAEA